MKTLKNWILLSRLPFLSVVILPYILGAAFARYSTGRFSLIIFWLGLAGAILIQLATHYSGEINDIKEDCLSINLEKNIFSGGSQVLVKSIILPGKVKALVGFAVFLALAIGAGLQFYFRTGPWTLFLGLSGLWCGIFYAQPPLRWVSRGTGEIFIAYAFGWLAVNTGFYLQAGHFNFLATLISVPVACAVVNIILINEYPDYPADILAGKRNLLVRIGKSKAAQIYTWLAAGNLAVFCLTLKSGFPIVSGVFYLPVAILALILAGRMLAQDYQDREKLEKMCGLTILVSWGTSLSYILGLLVKKIW